MGRFLHCAQRGRFRSAYCCNGRLLLGPVQPALALDVMTLENRVQLTGQQRGAITVLLQRFQVYPGYPNVHALIFPGCGACILSLSQHRLRPLLFGLYFFMTGLHAVHIIVGMVILGFMFVFVKRDKLTFDNFQLLENGGLYWHLVDLIWIFLFPLFYLIT